LVNESAKQAALQERIADDTRALRHTHATANPRAALELTQAEALEQRMDDCCPRPGQPAPCQFEPCPARSLSTSSQSRR
jgi:hypothetical protein